MELSDEKQVEILAKIWGKDRDGFVFLPWISGSARDSAGRRDSYHEGRAYEWPREREAIVAHLQSHPTDDVYFTPALFNAKRRIEQNVDAERSLWADLDPVDPRTLGDLKPTIAWETSPGRYQAVWLLNTPLTGASWPSRENHRLTLAIGADPSGWDSTQLLRVPGRRNHKPVYGDVPVAGRLLWQNGPRYVWADFDDLPAVGQDLSDLEQLADESTLDAVDRHQVWGRVRLQVSSRCRELVAARDTTGADRSDVLWEIERELADAGCSAVEIIAIVRSTVWNKYAGRNDELKRLKIEAARALSARGDTTILEGDDDAHKPGILWLTDVLAKPIPRPRWLVKNIWTQAGCGFIAGAPKSYKSWMALDLAISVATGAPFLGMFAVPEAQPVLYIQEEDDLRLVADRLEAIVEERLPDRFWQGRLQLEGSRVDWIPPTTPLPIALQVQTGFIASDPGWQAWLRDTVEDGQFGLVVIDTLGTTAGDIDTDRAQEMNTKILRPLKQIARTQSTALCIVHHNKKQADSSRAGQDMLGSTALHAWVDCAIYARGKDTSGIVVIEREAKLAPDQTYRLRIPTMYRNQRTGERVLWSPEFQVEDVSQPAAETAQQAARRGGSSTAGQRIAFKLKACGGGPMTLERLQAIVGGRSINDQVEAAIANGFIARDGDGQLVVS